MPKDRRFSQEAKIGDFKLGKTIGQGAFSKVKVGYHKETGQKVAIKVIDKKMMAEKVVRSSKRKDKMKAEQAAKKAAADAAAVVAATTPDPNATTQASDAPAATAPAPPAVAAHTSTIIEEPEEEAAAAEAAAPPPPPAPEANPEEEEAKDDTVAVNDAPTPPLQPEDDSDVPCISPISNPIASMHKDNNRSLVDGLYAEVRLLMRLDHPNIIGLYQVIDTEDECFIIMEYAAGGELIDYIAAKDRLSEKEARRFFRQLISAIHQCHQANVVHRDLKLDNLLLSGTRDILITDFGLGRTFRSDIDDLMMTFCGTPNYAAVELITFKPYIGAKADIWAIGVILFIMCSGRPPFQGSSIPSLYNKIMNVQYTCPDYFSQDLRNLLAKILVKDPAQRATMEQLFADPWVNYEEVEVPLRLPPMYNSLRESGMEQIMSISNASDYTVFTFTRYQTDFLSASKVAGVSASPSTSSMSGIVRRMSLSFAGDDDSSRSGSPTVGRREKKDKDSGMNRRLSMTMQRRASTARARSASPPGTPGAHATDALHAPSAVVVRNTRRSSVAEGSSPTTSPVSGVEGRRSPTFSGGVGLGLTTISESTAGQSRPAGADTLSPGNPRLQRRYSYQEGGDKTSRIPAAIDTHKANALYDGGQPQTAPIHGPAGAGSSLRPPGLDVFSMGMQVLPEPLSPVIMPTSMDRDVPPVELLISETSVPLPHRASARRKSVVPVGDSILYNLRTSGVSPDMPPDELDAPTPQAISEFHAIHRPAKTIRSLRFSFTMATTSVKPASAIFQDLHRVLILLQHQFQTLKFTRDRDLYLFTCTIGPQPTARPTESASGICSPPASPGGDAVRAVSPTLPMVADLPETAATDTDTAGAGGGASPALDDSANSKATTGPVPLVFEAEVCKVWLLRMHGVRVKRISGDTLAFKDIYHDLVSKLEI
ncbi:hypothetical protein RI367_007324 [Sorochytrium milnesiophthora]